MRYIDFQKREREEIMETIFQDKTLSLAYKMVLLTIARKSKQNGFCYPSLRQIAYEIGVSDSTVKRALNYLISHRYINKYKRSNNALGGKGGNLTNIYELTPEYASFLDPKNNISTNTTLFKLI